MSKRAGRKGPAAAAGVTAEIPGGNVDDGADGAGWFLTMPFQAGDRVRLFQVDQLTQRRYMVAVLSPDQCGDDYVAEHPLLGGGHYQAQILRRDGPGNSEVVRATHTFFIAGPQRSITDPTPLTANARRVPVVEEEDDDDREEEPEPRISKRDALDHLMLKQVVDVMRDKPSRGASVDWAALGAAFAPVLIELVRGRGGDGGATAAMLAELRGLREALADGGRRGPPTPISEALALMKELGYKPGGASGEEDGEEGEGGSMEKGMRFLLDLIGKAVDTKRPALTAGAEGGEPTMEGLVTAMVQRLRTAAAEQQEPTAAGAGLARDVPDQYRPVLAGLLGGPQVRVYLERYAPDLLTPELAPWTADVLEAVKAAL
jgi:hypothetical protein